MAYNFSFNLSTGTEKQFTLTRKPATSYIAGQIAPDWFLVRPLLIERETDDDGSYIISDLMFGVYGHGDSYESAHNDFVLSLIEFYELVEERAPSNPFTNALYGRLRMFLQNNRSFFESFTETDERLTKTSVLLNFSATTSLYRFNLSDAD